MDIDTEKLGQKVRHYFVGLYSNSGRLMEVMAYFVIGVLVGYII